VLPGLPADRGASPSVPLGRSPFDVDPREPEGSASPPGGLQTGSIYQPGVGCWALAYESGGMIPGPCLARVVVRGTLGCVGAARIAV